MWSLSPRSQLGYFHVIADPVSDCVHDILLFSPSHKARFGDAAENTAGVVIREPVLYRGIFHLGVFMDDDFHHCRVQLIAVTHRSGTAFTLT